MGSCKGLENFVRVLGKGGRRMNRREVKKALIASWARETKRMMQEERKARWILNKLAMQDTISARKRIVAACDELVERFE